MNSIIKRLFYKTYEDRPSKLRIITFIWFILMFIVFTASSSILQALIRALAFTVPVFSIGLIIRILFIDDENSKVEASEESNANEIKTIDDKYKEPSSDIKEIESVEGDKSE